MRRFSFVRLSPDCLPCGNTATVPPAAHSFLPCQKRMGRKEALEADRIVPQATEVPRRRTLRPTHGNLSAKLNYSAACVETTLPSMIVATQGDGKTRCCGNNSAPTYAPMVQNVCRGRCLHRPLQGAVHEHDPPSIPEMGRTEIDAVCPQVRVVHSAEPKAIGKVAALRPKRASNKFARVSAQYNASPGASFCLLFLAQQKKQARGATVAVLPQ